MTKEGYHRYVRNTGKVSMDELLPASSSKKKRKRMLNEDRTWQVLHRNKGGWFTSSVQSSCVTPCLRMLAARPGSENLWAVCCWRWAEYPGEALLKLDLILHFSSLRYWQHQLGEVEFCFDLILLSYYINSGKGWKGYFSFGACRGNTLFSDPQQVCVLMWP